MNRKNVGNILLWLGLLVFFVYSIQAIVELEEITNLRRYKSIGRVLKALSRPNLFVTEYEIRETPFVLEIDCRETSKKSQVVQVEERSITFEINCESGISPVFTIYGAGFLPNVSGSVTWGSDRFIAESQEVSDIHFRTDRKGNFMYSARVYYEDLSRGQTFIVNEHLRVVSRELSETSHIVVNKMWETVQIAFLATSISALFATLFAFLMARPSSWWGRGLNILLQPILSIIRSLHPLLTVIIFIVYAGLGAFAGVLALTLFSTAVLVEKFSAYSQVNMTLPWKELLKVRFPGLAFRHLPVNLTIATVIGFFGGGGIGFILRQNINLLNYHDAGVAILAIIIVTGSLDLISRAVWHRIHQAD